MKIRSITSLILILIYSTSCSTSGINTITATETRRQEWTPTSTDKRLAIATFTPMPTKSYISTPSPTRFTTIMPTITPFHSWTPLPTLEPTTALLLLEDLLHNNAGCILPCWWGLKPGKTTYFEAQHFLDSFAYREGGSGDLKSFLIVEYRFPFPEDLGTIDYAFGFRNGILEDIYKIYYGSLTTKYNLVEMLNSYGEPDDILISAYYETVYSRYMVVVVLFYLKTGILVNYNDNDITVIGDKIQACPQKARYPHLNLWSQSLNLTLQEAAKRYLDTMNWPPYRSLQDSTGISVETFYQIFKDVHNSSCLELNTADWPEF